MKYVTGYTMLEIRHAMFSALNYTCFETKKFT